MLHSATTIGNHPENVLFLHRGRFLGAFGNTVFDISDMQFLCIKDRYSADEKDYKENLCSDDRGAFYIAGAGEYGILYKGGSGTYQMIFLRPRLLF